MEQTTTTTVHDTPAVETREHPPLPASERDLRWKQASRNPRFRLALIVGGIVLLVAGFFLWRYLGSYESTDDAQINSHTDAMSTRVTGHVIKLLVNDNQFVEAGTPLVEIDPRDYRDDRVPKDRGHPGSPGGLRQRLGTQRRGKRGDRPHGEPELRGSPDHRRR